MYQCGSLGIGYWMPQIIKGFSEKLSHTQIGLIAMIPYIFATIVMVIWSRSSDKRVERRLHSAIPLAVAAAALGTIAHVANPFVATALISVSLAGLYAFKSPFWALPTLFLSRETAAVSIAVINSVGNLGGFVGPSLIGYVKGKGYAASTGLMFLAALLVIAFLMTILIKVKESKQSAEVELQAAEQK
ncbi:MFS transporter [Herbaspirillum huttiense]|uniref:MFS transporter n=1 Tax=Herbaspirillum huttiense TaxID=863372 RepID=UPI003CF45491